MESVQAVEHDSPIIHGLVALDWASRLLERTSSRSCGSSSRATSPGQAPEAGLQSTQRMMIEVERLQSVWWLKNPSKFNPANCCFRNGWLDLV
jgi:hypothetical protein